MKYSRFDGEIELTVEDLETFEDPDAGPELFATLEPDAQRIMTVALMPARGVLIERFDTHLAPPVQLAWVPDGSVAITRFDGDSVTIGQSHMRFVPAILAAMLRIDAKMTPRDRTTVRTTVGEVDDIVASIVSNSERDLEPSQFLGKYAGGWRCTGGWRNLPADQTMTVVTDSDGQSWLVDVNPADSVMSPFTELELTPLAGGEVLARLRRVVVGKAERYSQPSGEPVTLPTEASRTVDHVG